MSNLNVLIQNLRIPRRMKTNISNFLFFKCSSAAYNLNITRTFVGTSQTFGRWKFERLIQQFISGLRGISCVSSLSNCTFTEGKTGGSHLNYFFFFFLHVYIPFVYNSLHAPLIVSNDENYIDPYLRLTVCVRMLVVGQMINDFSLVHVDLFRSLFRYPNGRIAVQFGSDVILLNQLFQLQRDVRCKHKANVT